MPNKHTGVHITDIPTSFIQDYNLTGYRNYFVTDNATNNDAGLDEGEEYIRLLA